MSAPEAPSSHELATQFFDGRSPQPQPVTIRLDGDSLVMRRQGSEIRYPRQAVRWPERRRHGQQQAELPDGGLLQHADGDEWDAWWRHSGGQESRVARWQQNWRATLWATLGSLVFLGAAWIWGVPLLSKGVIQLIPPSLEQDLGEKGLEQLTAMFLEPSTLPKSQQEAIRQRFEQLVKGAHPQGEAPAWTLSFHSSRALGPNALALPGGYIVLTDELVQMMRDRPDVLQGVLAHELGHVVNRDGLDILVRASLVSAMVGVVLGDASGFLAAVPTTLMTQAYSRDAERAADQFAAAMLHANGLSPALMAVFFERITKHQQASDDTDGLPIAISSHPGHEERIRFFKEWKSPAH